MSNPIDRIMVAAYSQMVTERIEAGFLPFMMTFMFNALPGGSDAMKIHMEREIERLYALLLTRMIRHPDRKALDQLPLWIVTPDQPVPKHHKKPLREVLLNDGRHAHGTVLIPAVTRLPERFDLYVIGEHDRFAGRGRSLARVQVLPIHETPDRAVAYAMKSLTRGTASTDDILILPRTHGEMKR